jgi:hypothetical protein
MENLKFYNLKITRQQAETISMACEFLSRIQGGQVKEIFEHLPIKEDVDYSRLHDIGDEITKMMPEILKDGIDGWRSSFGVSSPRAAKTMSIAWDLHTVIRHKISIEKAVEKGIIESEDSPRKFPEMMTVNFDPPMKYSDQPLAQITRIEPSEPSQVPSANL